MIDKTTLDEETLRQAEIIADIEGVTLDELLEMIDQAKKDFYKSQLS